MKRKSVSSSREVSWAGRASCIASKEVNNGKDVMAGSLSTRSDITVVNSLLYFNARVCANVDWWVNQSMLENYSHCGSGFCLASYYADHERVIDISSSRVSNLKSNRIKPSW